MTLNENLDQPVPFHSPWWTRALRLIADRNPFYLISAACMLGGCLALTNSLSWLSLPLPRLLLLIGTINVYEALLIGLALLLLGRGLLRDGKILLILEAFFLVDVTFLNAEVVTANLHLGILLSIALFILAFIKLRLVMKALGTELPPARFVYVMAQIAALLTIPCVLRAIDHGSVSPGNFYAVWWIVGLMPVIGELALHIWGEGHITRLSGPAAVFVTLPLVSLIAHVGILHYVYGVEYFGAMGAPVLLGLAISMKHAIPASRSTQQQILILRLLLPLAAVMISLNNPHVLTFTLHPISSMTVTPTSLAVAGAYLTYVYCFLLPLAAFLLAIGAVVAAGYIFGPSTSTIQHVGNRGWDWMVHLINWIVPNTLAGWGFVSVLASFFFLILGAAISLARPRPVLDGGNQTPA